jgi:hypothetical protein
MSTLLNDVSVTMQGLRATDDMGSSHPTSRPVSAACSPQDAGQWQPASQHPGSSEQGALPAMTLSQRSHPGPPVILSGGPARALAAYQTAVSNLQQNPAAGAGQPDALPSTEVKLPGCDNGAVGQQGSTGAAQHPLARPSPCQEVHLFRGTLFSLDLTTFTSKCQQWDGGLETENADPATRSVLPLVT